VVDKDWEQREQENKVTRDGEFKTSRDLVKVN